jgi:hypothetical protein
MVPYLMRRRTAAALALAAIGCDENPRDRSVPTVRDSSGIRIVENVDPSWAPAGAWLVDSVPLVTIGTRDDELFRVVGAVRQNDGTIVVANAGNVELRFYDRSGTFLRAVGGRGQGPGEFMSMTSIHRLASDSILVHDWQQAKASVFAADGEYSRSFSLQIPGNGLPQLIGVLQKGHMVAVVRPFEPNAERSGLIRIPSLYLIYSQTGEITATIGELPDQELFIGQPQEPRSYEAPPFGRWAATVAVGDRFVYGDATTHEYRVYSPEGALLQIVRRQVSPRMVTSDDIARHKAERLRNIVDQSRRAAVERELAEAVYPEQMPAYTSFEADTEGRVWIQPFAAQVAATAEWSIFDPDGAWLGQVELPSSLSIFEIGADYILGRWRDPDGVEQVRVYRLARDGS